MIEIDRVSSARSWLNLPPPRPPAAFQHLDLRGVDGFDSGDVGGCLFLSCVLSPAQAGYLTSQGATVIRDDPQRPFTAHRSQLYTPDELFAGFTDEGGYGSTWDAEVYRHWVATGRQHPAEIDESLARRLHDHSITDALHEAIAGRRIAAIMGGHGIERSSEPYRQVAILSRSLTRTGLTMASGGGPGAMEATHLGAWMSSFDDADLDQALAILSPRPAGAEPGREYADPDWLHRALQVTTRWPLPDGHPDSLGIPTWTYGHEPPAAFATMVAKYFANSVREEGVLAIATNGVVFTPGSAGTVQEIFQDGCQNHYASWGPPTPMILFGVDYWTSTVPVWPVLERLSDGRDYGSLLTITDDPDEVIEIIPAHRSGEVS